MKKLIFIASICFFSVGFSQNIKLLYSEEGLSFRGLSPLNDSVVWVSGNKGTVLRTEDGGKTFEKVDPKGYEKHDFRDIEVINDSTAIIMGIASPGVILLTEDKGLTWAEIYRDEHPDVFMDAMYFLTTEDGDIENIFTIGDAIENNSMYAVFLKNKNRKVHQKSYFERRKNDQLLTLAEGEAFFAASGTNLFVKNADLGFIISGGKQSNLYYINDELEENIKKHKLPMLQGKESTGANSITFNPKINQGMIVGGDFLEPDLVEGNSTMFKVVNDSIEFIKPKRPPNGYRSCVDFIEGRSLITCGLNGVDMSLDGGEDWFSIGKESYHVCLKARDTFTVFFAGSNGKIGKLDLENFNVWEAIKKNKEENQETREE